MTSISAEEEVAALVARYLISLDDEKLDEDWARRLFTDDVCVEFPMNRHDGIEGVVEYHRRSLAAFARTQHLGSHAAVDVEGDRATLRANLIATHLHPPAADGTDGGMFMAGTFLSGGARRTPDGWRLSRVRVRLVWSNGSPSASPSGPSAG